MLAFCALVRYNKKKRNSPAAHRIFGAAKEGSMYDFIYDLDEYFCEKYANYDKLCILPGYKTPMMQATKIDEYGRTRAYTLPANTMRLALQPKKQELLALLKERLTDKTFSFSFQPRKLWTRIKAKFSKRGFHKTLKVMAGKSGLTLEEMGNNLEVSKEIWKGICKGKYLPTKNLVLSIALTAQFSLDYTNILLRLCDMELDMAQEKDVVISYLLHNKVYNRGMIDAALGEYNIRNLFMKE